MNTLVIVIIVCLAVLSTPLSLKKLIDRQKYTSSSFKDMIQEAGHVKETDTEGEANEAEQTAESEMDEAEQAAESTPMKETIRGNWDEKDDNWDDE